RRRRARAEAQALRRLKTSGGTPRTRGARFCPPRASSDMRAAVRGVALTLILALAHVASAQDTADSTADRAASGSNGRRARLSDRGISFDFESGLTTTVALKPFPLSADLQF